MKKFIYLLPIILFLIACNKDEEITQEIANPPIIEFDSEDGIYSIKVGREIVITPTYKNVESAIYTWTCDGRTLSKEPQLKHTFNQCGSYYVTLQVENQNARAEEEIRIDVNKLTPPIISLVTPVLGFNATPGYAYLLTPDIQHAENATFSWMLNGQKVGSDSSYTFQQNELGSYNLTLTVTNEDGKAEKSITIQVVDKLPIGITIPPTSYFASNNTRYVALGRSLYLRSYTWGEAPLTYRWSINGENIVEANQAMYKFKPTETGTYTLTCTAINKQLPTPKALTRNITVSHSQEVSTQVQVICCQPAPSRPFIAGNSICSNKVYEYVPAPGQFINEIGSKGGFNGENTPEAACQYAQKRLEQELFVSLGGFGGYIIVGFDHSLENKGGYDFSIKGNTFDNSCEPGIVWVMQDTNGNGLPDDEWYELKGSEYGKPETIQNYAITYTRPAAFSSTPWEDNRGQKGKIARLGNFHPQEYYYPLWIKEDSYTLYGTCLKARTHQNPTTGIWENQAFGGGYADNIGDDMPLKDNPNANALPNYFKISDAVQLDGTPANLAFIDFIKVQTGVNVTAPQIGENSTEVMKFCDENNSTKP